MKGKQNKVKGHRTIVSIAAVLVVAIMLFPALGFAAETSYQATTNVTGNSIDVDYYTVGLYTTADGSTYQSNFIKDSGIKYTKNGTTYSLLGNEISSTDVYFRIDADEHTPGDGAEPYVLTVYAVSKIANTQTSSSTYTIELKEGSTTKSVTTDNVDTVSLKAGVGYKFSLKPVNVQLNNLADPPANITLEIVLTFTVTDTNNADSIANSPVVVMVVSGGSMADALAAVNPDPGWHNNNPTLDIGGEITLGGFTGVNVHDGGTNGSFDDTYICHPDHGQLNKSVNIKMPQGYDFIIYFSSTSGTYHVENTSVKYSVTTAPGHETYKLEYRQVSKITGNNNVNLYLTGSNSWWGTQNAFETAYYKEQSVPSADWIWFPGTNADETITITFDSTSGAEVSMFFLFKPMAGA